MSYTSERRTIEDATLKRMGMWGIMLSGSKLAYSQQHPDHEVYYNANLFVEGYGKLWFGDVDLTRDADKLQALADEIGACVYILYEHDGRFDTENRPDYAKVAKWASKATGETR